jgi:acetoin utilization protein AcuB
MLVRDYMSKKVITVQHNCPTDEARALLRKHRIRQLPVLNGERLAGIVTDRDLRSALDPHRTVGDLMPAKLAVIRPDASVDEAARLLRTHKIGALPVVEGRKLVGILSVSDVLDAFVEFCGVAEPTYHMIVSGGQHGDPRWHIRRIIEQKHGDLKWIYRDRRTRNVHLRLKARHAGDIVSSLEAAGFDVSTLMASSGRQRA